MIYANYNRNHVILPGRTAALEAFLKKGYKGIQHKMKNSISSHSEDALTWSCFDLLAQLTHDKKLIALDELLEDAYDAKCNFTFTSKNYAAKDIEIEVGKTYTGPHTRESTELDASIETPDKLIFFEAKLYSSISLKDDANGKPHDQIARKLRVGIDCAHHSNKEFYFIFLDIAPPEILLGLSPRKSKQDFEDHTKAKWKSAWLFKYYKQGRNRSLKPLDNILEGVKTQMLLDQIAGNMGWLTWTDLFKIVMRAYVQ